MPLNCMPLNGDSIVCKEIADALGIKNCVRLTLCMEAGKTVSVHTLFYPEEEEMKEVALVLKKYNLRLEEV